MDYRSSTEIEERLDKLISIRDIIEIEMRLLMARLEVLTDIEDSALTAAEAETDKVVNIDKVVRDAQ